MPSLLASMGTPGMSGMSESAGMLSQKENKKDAWVLLGGWGCGY
jgi:hypothetical protein